MMIFKKTEKLAGAWMWKVPLHGKGFFELKIPYNTEGELTLPIWNAKHRQDLSLFKQGVSSNCGSRFVANI